MTFLSHLREMGDVAATPVIAMSTAAVLDHNGAHLPVDGTLIKPITQQTLASVREPYQQKC